MTEAPRGFRIRWWMWVAASALTIALALLLLRLYGMRRLATVESDLHALGLATTPADILDRLPPVDPERQHRIEALQRGLGAWTEKPGRLPFGDLQERRTSAGEQADQRTMLAAGAADAAALDALCAAGPVRMSTLGPVWQDAVALERTDPERLYTASWLPLLPVRGVVNWWGVTACQAADPAPALRSLDRICRADRNPLCVLDAMMLIAFDAMHDQVRLYMATRGRLPADELRDWLADDARPTIWVAQGLAGERCLLRRPLWRLRLSQMDTICTGFGGPTSWSDRLTNLPAWLLVGFEGAQAISMEAGTEAELRQLPRPAPSRMPFGLPPLGGLASYSDEIAVTGIEAAYGRRLQRIAGAIASRHRAGAALPANGDELALLVPTSLLAAAGALEPAVRYEQLGPARFRIGMDPSAPLPALIPASRRSPTYGTHIGQPPAAKSWNTTRWSLEIDLDAILIPPPERPKKPAKAAP